VAVLAARYADHDAIAVADHAVVGDRLPDLPAQALGELAGFVFLSSLVEPDGVDGHAMPR
jgi:hypothetical protein